MLMKDEDEEKEEEETVVVAEVKKKCKKKNSKQRLFYSEIFLLFLYHQNTFPVGFHLLDSVMVINASRSCLSEFPL